MQPGDQQNSGNWTFRPEGQDLAPVSSAQPIASPDQLEPITWTASEYVAHHKNTSWYVGLFAVIGALCTFTYIFTKDIISVVAISIAVILYLLISGAKPRQRTYTLNDQGITIDGRQYSYGAFKSFAIAQEGAMAYVNLIPLKRLMPEISIYFAPEDGDRIIDLLEVSLPNDQRREHGLDRLAKRLRL